MEFLLFLAIAFALGFKHSYDADHLVAVSAILTRNRGDARRVLWLGLSWAVGHMATAAVITVLLFLSASQVGLITLSWFESAVAWMLIAIGLLVLAFEHPRVKASWRVRFHRHEHEHAGEKHEHHHVHLLGAYREHGLMVGIGIVHGLASNDELLILLLPVLTITSLAGLLVGVLLFSLGVVAGMILFSWAVTFPLRRWNTEKVRFVVAVATAVLSIAYGVALLAGFEGFNPFR